MKRIWRTALSLLFCVTFQSIMCAGLNQPFPSQAKQNEQNTMQHDKADDPFKKGMMGDGNAFDGTRLSIVTFDTPSGERVAVTTGKFRSQEAAQEQLRQWTDRAKIIQREPYKDAFGTVVGYRLIAQYAKTEQKGAYYAVTWTQDRELYWVASQALKTVLAEEKKLQADKKNSEKSIK